jgi:pimeloyl-ACP methyl ester carboxylesterase
MTSEQISFVSDEATLEGTLSLPDGGLDAPVLVVAHGAQAGSRDYFLYRHLDQLLRANGVGTFRFDRRGEGASGGRTDASFTQLSRDLSEAVGAVSDHPRVDAGRVGLWGVSQGGWISLLTAADRPSIAALVIVSGTPVTPARQMTHAVREILTRRGYGEDVVEKVTALRATVEGFARGELPLETVAPLVERANDEAWFADAWIPPLDEVDWTDMDLDVEPLIESLRSPTLLLFGADDPWIPIDESIRIWRRAAPSALALTIEVIDGVGHEMVAADPLEILVSGQPARAYEETLVRWIGEHLRTDVRRSGDDSRRQSSKRRAAADVVIPRTRHSRHFLTGLKRPRRRPIP